MDACHKEPHGGSLGRKIVAFSGFLKRHGFKVFPSCISEALTAVDALDLSDRRDFFYGLRASLVRSDMEWKLFEGLFDSFWGNTPLMPPPGEESSDNNERDNNLSEVFIEEQEGGETIESNARENSEIIDEKETLEGGVYSPVPYFEKEALERLRPEDLKFARLALKNMIAPLRFSASRRRRPSRKQCDMDFRRTFRESLKSGGIPLRVHYKKKRKRLRRLVILADVSGSMDRYARFVLPFIMGIKGSSVRAEVFVFSTTLTRITKILRHYEIDEALDRITSLTPDWSGGTRIGHSLRQFNRDFGDRIVNHQTVVVILSDGWDLGAKEILRGEMATLHRRSRRVIWLNPIAGDPDFAPLLKGMGMALPYIHHHLPVTSLRHLSQAGRILASEISS